jgi:hypothetical protein
VRAKEFAHFTCCVDYKKHRAHYGRREEVLGARVLKKKKKKNTRRGITTEGGSEN